MAKKTAFIGFKEEPKVAARLKAVAAKQGGISKVLQMLVRKFLQKAAR